MTENNLITMVRERADETRRQKLVEMFKTGVAEQSQRVRERVGEDAWKMALASRPGITRN